MSFYSQYEKVCAAQGIDPCSQRAADMFGVTRATISIWNSKNKAPKGDTVRVIADQLGVSADYLLERTDNPTDYTNPDLIAELSGPVLDAFDGDVEKALKFQNAVAADAKAEKHYVQSLYDRLDAVDKVRVEAYIEGILTGDKYTRKEKTNAS